MNSKITQLLIQTFFFCLCTPLIAQSWTAAERYSSPANSYLESTSTTFAGDGSMYVVGNFQNMVCFDTLILTAPLPNRNFGFLLKLDAEMQPVWAKAFPQNTYDVSVDAQGNVLVAGSHWKLINPNDSLAYLAKYSSNGALIGSFSAAGTAESWGKVVRTDAAGNCYLAGERSSAGTANFGTFSFPPTNSRECFLLKLSPDLSQVIWAKYTGLSSDLDNVYDLEIDETNGAVYASGNYSQDCFFLDCALNIYNGDFYVEKHSTATGNTLWKKIFSGGSGTVTKQFARLSPDAQSLLVVGNFKYTTTFEAGLSLTAVPPNNDDYHIFAAQINAADAKVQWAKKISTSGDSYLWRVVRKNDDVWLFGHFLYQTAMGPFILNPNARDGFLTQISADGTVVNAERLFGANKEDGYGLAQRDSVLAVTGISESPMLNIGTFGLPGNSNSVFVARKGGLPQLAPVAGFTSSPGNGCVPLTVQFNNTSYQSPTSYNWLFPGGTPSSSTAKNPSVIYYIPGTYSVTLRVSNGGGSDTLVETNIITVAASNITAGFSSATNGFTANFNNTSTNASTFIWDFGDGQTSTEVSPAHVYANCGTYTVSLTSSNACSAANSTQSVTVGIASPIPAFSSTPNGLMVSFTNTSSNASAYVWDFGDGNSSTEANPAHTYSGCGTYLVSLTSSNACSSVTNTQSVTVGIASPVSAFSSTPNGLMVSFTNTSSNASTYVWDFGDGNSSTEADPAHIYSGCGTYLVTLTSSNICGTATSTAVLTLGNGMPTSGFTSTANGLIISFQNTSANANAYLWDFGDGNVSTESNTVHSYVNCGPYTVILTTSNECGTSSSTETVVATDFPMAIFTTLVDALEVSFSNNSTGGTTYFWEFGDGNTSTLQYPPPHIYADSGTFVITLVVSNNCGASILQQTISVFPCATAGFETNTSGLTAVFQNHSENAISYLWDFGDGQTSADENPVHNYAAAGTYLVTLTSTNGCGPISFSMSVTVTTVGTKMPEWIETFRVYPNPNPGVFWIEMNGKWTGQITFEIFNPTGQLIFSETNLSPKESVIQQIDMGEVPAGLYWFSVRTTSKIWGQKVMMMR